MISYPGARSAPSNAPGGVLLSENADIAQTVQCCHCGCHFLYIKGSGKFRSHCIECNRMTCGGYYCLNSNMKTHMAWAKRLQLHNDNPSKYPLDPRLWDR